MAVVMYMVKAPQYFEGMSKDKIKEIALEIAMQGAHGYKLEGESYRVSSIKNKYSLAITFWHTTCQLGISNPRNAFSTTVAILDKEHELALNMYKSDES